MDLNTELQRILNNRMKVGNRRVNVKVEVDKFNYRSDVFTEFDELKYEVEGTDPVVLSGEDTGDIAPGITYTSSTTMGSPVKGQTISQVLQNLTSEYQVLAVNGRQRTIDGETRDHHGTDFGYGKGTEITAVADGIVIAVQSGAAYEDLGTVAILHANGVATRYLHVDPIYVNKGQEVRQGEVICKVSATDQHSTGPHLHFEVHVNFDRNTGRGETRDPVPFLEGDKSIAPHPSKDFSAVVAGVINEAGAVLRERANISADVVKELNEGDSVEVHSYDGEWYLVDHNGDRGAVFSSFVTIEAETTSNIPTRAEIIDYLTSRANSLGIPSRLALATAWTESEMTQFISDGSPFQSTVPDPNGPNGREDSWGIMQIHFPSHGSAFNTSRLKNDWQYNIDSGLTILKEKYEHPDNRAEHIHPNGMIRGAYCGYNSGSNFSRYRTADPPDARDVNFWNHYTERSWEATGTEITFGKIEGSAVPIKVSAEKTSKTLRLADNGEVYSYDGEENGFYRLTSNRTEIGYVEDRYFTPMRSSFTKDYYQSSKFYDDFSNHSPNLPPKDYTQDPMSSWVVVKEGSESDLVITGGEEGENHISFSVQTDAPAQLDLGFSLDLAEGNIFRVFINGELHLNMSDIQTQGMRHAIQLSKGSSIIRLQRNKTTAGGDTIKIHSIKAYEHVYKADLPNIINPIVSDNQDIVEYVYVVSDKANLYEEPDGSLYPTTLTRGDVIKLVEFQGEWAKVNIDDIVDVYIRKDLVEIHPEYRKDGKVRYRSGRFVYDRTLELDNVQSVDIDYRFEMRMANAVITITNEKGFYSPDYMPQRFPELGAKKSEFVEYDGTNPLGVLSDNTPIRIYIGYGDNPPRRFTGLIDGVDISDDNKTLTIRCSDMMKKLSNYRAYTPENYPPNDMLGYMEHSNYAWLGSSIISDLARKAGMNSWRVVAEDLNYPDVMVQETFFTDIQKEYGQYVKMSEQGIPELVDIDSLPADGGFRNPYMFPSVSVREGEVYADVIDRLCEEINFWQRCNMVGTYLCTPVEYSSTPAFYFKDDETISTLNKTIDFTNTVNHIIVAGAGRAEHFIDDALWKATKGERRTARVEIPWANTYGKKLVVAKKLFNDIKMRATTLQAVIEGNPYLDLMDTIHIEHRDTTTKDKFVVKAMKDSWSVENAYTTTIDLFWGGDI